MWQALLPDSGMKGHLQDSNGFWVPPNCKAIAQGIYHLFEANAGGQQSWASLHRRCLQSC